MNIEEFEELLNIGNVNEFDLSNLITNPIHLSNQAVNNVIVANPDLWKKFCDTYNDIFAGGFACGGETQKAVSNAWSTAVKQEQERLLSDAKEKLAFLAIFRVLKNAS